MMTSVRLSNESFTPNNMRGYTLLNFIDGASIMTNNENDIESKALTLFEQALEQPQRTRDDFIEKATAGDEVLKAQVLRLLKLDSQKTAKILTGQAVFNSEEEDLSNAEIGSYLIKELIGKGGMGAVYKAERKTGDFTHNVAVKVIRPGVLSEPLVERFERERQTLADFSHPNIARLFDGGTTEDGAPYIIMEYIDGQAITDFVKTNKLTKLDSLSLFKQACNAISYAHQNLIVHRDITPNNVLVTREGDVKLIDFGIAKALHENAITELPQNSLGSLSFTPGFAAPERSKGATANTLSDIYSLGKLLKALLPEKDRADELNAIIEKATYQRPQSRYASVDALIDDINNYIHDFPVVAVPSKSSYRISKFLKRHRVGTLASGLAILGLITAVGIITYQYNRAETARVEADKRFNDVRTLAETLMTDIHDEIYRIPGSTQATKKIIEASQTYLDDLAKDKRAPIDIKREAAIGYRKLGVAVAGSKYGNITDPEAADHYFETSRQLLVKLDETSPPDIETLRALGLLYYNMAEISILPRKVFDVAQTQLQTSLNYLQRGIDLDPTNLPVRLAYQYSYCYQGEIWLEQGESEKAKDILKQCILQAENLHIKFPDNLGVIRSKASSGRTLANAYSIEKKYAEAIAALDVAIVDAEIAATLTDAETDGYLMRDQTIGYWRRAYAHSNMKNYETAISDYEKALEFTHLRLDIDPSDKDASWFFNTIIAERAGPLQALGRHSEAEDGLLQALNWYEKRYEAKPKSAGRLANLFVHQLIMGDFYKKVPNKTKSCASLAESKRYYERMQEDKTASAIDDLNYKELIDLAKDCGF